MKNRFRFLVPGSVALLLFFVAVAPAPAQDPALEMAKEEPESAAFANPNEHHAHLAQFEGNWMAQVRIFPAPGAEVIEGRGIARNEMMLGGRFLKMDFKGELMGQSMQGFGMDGFDVQSGKHVGIWADSMGTRIWKYAGTCANDGKEITMIGEYNDPTTGEIRTKKSVTTIVSTTRYTYQEWDVRDDEEPVLTMQAIFSRQ